MVHWCRLFHRGCHHASMNGRPLEVLFPFRGSPVLGEDGTPLRTRDNFMFNHFHDAGCNVTAQDTDSKFVWEFINDLKEDKEFALHRFPELIWVHLPERCNPGGTQPLDKPPNLMDKKTIDQVVRLITWAVRNNKSKFVIELPQVCVARYYELFKMAFLGNLREEEFGHATIDMCFFGHSKRCRTHIISNEPLLIAFCDEYFNHHYRNTYPSRETPCENNHGGAEDPNFPDRRLHINFVREMINHFQAIFRLSHVRRNPAKKTLYKFLRDDISPYDVFVADATQTEDKEASEDEWLDMNYHDHCIDYYHI